MGRDGIKHHLEYMCHIEDVNYRDGEYKSWIGRNGINITWNMCIILHMQIKEKVNVKAGWVGME